MKHFGIPVAVTLVLTAAAAAQPTPLGPPVQVNSAASSVEIGQPSVSSTATGAFVVSWSSRSSAYWRYHYRTGVPRGPENLASGPFSDPIDVSAGPQGSFVMVWAENGDRISSQRFRVDGSPIGGIAEVSAPQEGSQNYPAVARIPATGGHVVVWFSVEDDPWGVDVKVRRYDSNGQPLAPPLRTHQIRRLSQTLPDVAALPDGGYVVVWQTDDISGIPTRGIFVRFFDRNGQPRGQEVRVDSGTRGAQLNAQVATSSVSGESVIVWEALDDHGLGIFARRYDALGNPMGGEFQVNDTGVLNHQKSPGVAMSPQGDFVVTWSWEHANPQESEIRARWFRHDGASSSEFQVDAGPASLAPAVAIDNFGEFTIVWLDSDNAFSAPTRVMAQRFASNGSPGWSSPALQQ